MLKGSIIIGSVVVVSLSDLISARAVRPNRYGRCLPSTKLTCVRSFITGVLIAMSALVLSLRLEKLGMYVYG